MGITNRQQPHSSGELLKKLELLYDKEDALKKEMYKLKVIYEQLQEDKDMLETAIMYQCNKEARMRGDK